MLTKLRQTEHNWDRGELNQISWNLPVYASFFPSPFPVASFGNSFPVAPIFFASRSLSPSLSHHTCQRERERERERERASETRLSSRPQPTHCLSPHSNKNIMLFNLNYVPFTEMRSLPLISPPSLSTCVTVTQTPRMLHQHHDPSLSI